MKCLQKYQWVKLHRQHLPDAKGIMGAWMKLASRAAFRKGVSSYCGYKNPVEPGMWAGGVVGLKSILGCKSRSKALEMLEKLSTLGYLEYDLDKETKKLTYQITDWVVKCSGAACTKGATYTTDGYGFLCLPRNITERLAQQHFKFEEADAWLDLWCHTVWEDPDNGFSFFAPVIQYGKYGANLTLETLGQRWGWEKTKVWRFLKKHGDAFALYRLPGSYGCLIFNKLYPTGAEVSLPAQEEVVRIFKEIRSLGANTPKGNVGQTRFGKLVAWFSRKISRVALLTPIIRAYISPPKSWKNVIDDCKGRCYSSTPVDLTQIGKELFDYEEPGRKFDIQQGRSQYGRKIPGIYRHFDKERDFGQPKYYQRENSGDQAAEGPKQLSQHHAAPSELPHTGLGDGVFPGDGGGGTGRAV